MTGFPTDVKAKSTRRDKLTERTGLRTTPIQLHVQPLESHCPRECNGILWMMFRAGNVTYRRPTASHRVNGPYASHISLDSALTTTVGKLPTRRTQLLEYVQQPIGPVGPEGALPTYPLVQSVSAASTTT